MTELPSDLKACPFCGESPKRGWHGAGVPGMDDCGYYGIDCCNAFAHADDEEAAATQWNRRAREIDAAPAPAPTNPAEIGSKSVGEPTAENWRRAVQEFRAWGIVDDADSIEKRARELAQEGK